MVQSGLIINGKPLKVNKIYPFRIGFLNDIHVCSQMGVFPEEGYVDRYGTHHMPNPGQRIMNKYLDRYAEECRINKVNQLWIPGDTIIGSNRIESGKFVKNIELDDQKKVAAKVIAEFVKKVPTIEKVYLWDSTGYHDSRDTGIDSQIVDKLKADYNVPAEYLGEYSLITLKYKDYEKKIFITHPASGGVVYPETAMGRDMLFWQEGVAEGKLPNVDMIIRAHKHEFIEVHKPHIRALQLPCWQYFVPYDGALKNFARYQPDIGSVIILLDEKLRATVWHFIYPNIIEPSRFLKIELDKGVKEVCLS